MSTGVAIAIGAVIGLALGIVVSLTTDVPLAPEVGLVLGALAGWMTRRTGPLVTLPVSDVDRAKSFYESLGWRLDAGIVLGDETRVVQFTPPRSNASISFGKGLTTAEPGSAQRFELVVSDIEAARDDLIGRGVEVSEPFPLGDGGFMPGPDPQRRSYLTYASFSDPDGNGWILQEVNDRLPGRLWED